jgi:hypothetical protein
MWLRLAASLRVGGALLAVLIFDPLGCSGFMSWAAEFPPSIVITEGKTFQGFPYLSGGEGFHEREILEARSKSFNVKLVFAENRGPYLADVKLAIDDADGIELAAFDSVGPYFYINLPPGRYHIRATYMGKTKRIRNIQVVKDNFVNFTLTWHDIREAPAIARAILP